VHRSGKPRSSLHAKEGGVWGKRRARRRADGSANAPFPTIAAALAYAREQGFAQVEVRLAPGHYRERVELVADTALVGAEPGSVSIEGPVINYGHELKLRDLGIRGRGAYGILSLGDGSATDLRCVAISGCEVAVQQSGGRLLADWLSVRGTRATARPGTGIGILAGNGAKAELRNVALDGNGSQALVLRLSQTVAVVENLYVARTGWHPSLLGGPDLREIGAVHVGDGATLFGSQVRLERNALCGMLAAGWRSGAHLRHTVVTRTLEVDELLGVNASGGNALSAVHGGALELEAFALEDSDLVGLAIGESCWVSARNGRISRNVIGAYVGDPDFPFELITDNVAFEDNDINVQAVSLPIPNLNLDPLSESSPTSAASPPSAFAAGRTRVRWQDPYRFPLRLFDEQWVRGRFGFGR
jgi:hypothetical protein